MKRTRLVTGVLLAGLSFMAAAPSPCSGAETLQRQEGRKINLRPKFTKGQEIRYTMRLDASTKLAGEAAPGDGQRIEQDIGLLLRVRDVSPETGASVDLVYESLKFKLTQGDTVMDFDSTKPARKDEPADAMLRPIVGLTLELKIDKDGNITSVSGGEKLAAGPGAMLANNFTGADVIRSLMGRVMTLRRGTGEASVGESWTDEDVIASMMGDMKITTTTTLKSMNGATATLGLRGVFGLSPTGGTTGLPSISVKDSTYTGEAQWNTETGTLQSMTTRQTIAVEQTLGDKTLRSTNELVTTVRRVQK
ncbi:MAG: hypothetical protein HUU18_05395 [Phycisphaerales bacterium]|nr:hypothetical protein [Phycisphaerales bacterium]